MHGRVDDLAEVVRRDVRRHADRDALAAVDQQVRVARRQCDRLLGGAVVVRPHVDGVLVDVGEQLHRQRVEAALGVARGGRPEVGAAVVAVEVDQRVPQRERLRHPDQRVVDRTVTVGVVGPHRVARDAGALDERSVGAEPLLLHVPDDPAVDRLEPVAHVGQGTRHDDRHRVVEERVLHLVLERDRLDRIVAFGALGPVGVDGRRRCRGVTHVRLVSLSFVLVGDLRSRGCARPWRWW